MIGFVTAIILFVIILSIKSIPIISADSALVKITGDVVNVREKPGTSYSIITQIKKGETYSLENEQNGWYEIRLPSGEKGWIANWLATNGSNVTASDKGVVTANNLNVRSEPSLSGQVVGQLQKGQEVNIYERQDEWSQIFFQNKTAWVSSQYIAVADEDSLAMQKNTSIKTLHSGTNIRKEPTLKSTILKQASAGEIFQVVEKLGDWYKVQLDTGQSGYVASWIVSEVTSAPVYASNNQKGIQGKVIVIDPGHGGRDQGATGKMGTLEKDITLSTSALLANKLRNAGAQVILTRSIDEYKSLQQRTNIAIHHRADAFISIHYDSIDNATVHGHTTYYYSEMDKKLADRVHVQIVDRVNLRDRGVRQGNYFVLRENPQPSILLELGYLSNAFEEGVIKSRPYQESVAEAIFKGLHEYYTN